MDPPETPNLSQGSSETASPNTPFRNVTRRPSVDSDRARDDTSQQLLGSTSSLNDQGAPSAVTLGLLPAIIEVSDTGDEGEPRTEVDVDTLGATPTPLTGMSSELLEYPQNMTEDSANESSVHTGEELDDSDVETTLEAVIASHNISKRSIIDALKERTLRLKEGGPISDHEYIRIAREVANYEAGRYAAKRLLRGSRTPSITSSHGTAIMHAKAFVAIGKRKEPELGFDNDHYRSAGPSSSQQSKTEVVPPETKTVPTESMSMDEDQRAPFYKPPPADWRDRVNSQRARNHSQKEMGWTLIPDQGVVFDGHIPYDAWARDAQAPGGDKETNTEVKRESVKPTLHPEPKTASLIEPHDRHVTKRAHFIGNTSITPMSQQFYPGRLSQGADLLLGPRFVDQQHKEIENKDRGPGPPQD
jgi:hypothetical protein